MHDVRYVTNQPKLSKVICGKQLFDLRICFDQFHLAIV